MNDPVYLSKGRFGFSDRCLHAFRVRGIGRYVERFAAQIVNPVKPALQFFIYRSPADQYHPGLVVYCKVSAQLNSDPSGTAQDEIDALLLKRGLRYRW